MNEKEKKSLIIISSVFIFILVFMVFFTFYRRDAMLSDRTIPKINTEIDPPSHGDCNSSCSNSCKSASPGTSQYNYCYTQCMSSCSNPVVTPAPTADPTAAPTAAPRIRPSGCKTEGACQSEAAACPNGSNGCSHTSTEDGFYCYTQTCKSSSCSTAPCCINGTTVTSTTVCMENSSATCGACPTPTPSSDPVTPPSTVNCCVNGTFRTNVLESQCSTNQRLSGGACVCETGIMNSSGVCTNVTPTPIAVNCSVLSQHDCNSQAYDRSCKWCSVDAKCKSISDTCTAPVPTATPKSITCYQFDGNSCSSVSVTEGSCESKGYYSDWTSCRSNIQCGSNEYLYGNSCLSCGTNKSVVSSKCQGNASTCCESNTNTTGCNANEYLVNGSCKYCPPGYIATDAHPTCHMNVAAGGGVNTAGSSMIETCPSGTYSVGGIVDLGSTSKCISCGSGKSSKVGATSAADCYSLDGVTTDDCTVTTTTKARDVSYHGGNGNSDGSISSSQGYYVVEVEVNGKGCSGQTLTFNYDNTEGTGNGTYTVYDGFKMTYIAKITDQEVCNSTASVTGVLKDSTGKVTSTSNPATVNTSTDWGLTEKAQCVDKSYLEEHGRNSRNSAENADVDLYYIVLDQTIKNADGSISSRCPDPDNQLMVDVWTRACATCGGTPPTIPVTETDTPSLVYACYGNGRTVESSTSTVWATGSSSAYPYYLSGVSESDCHPYGCYTNGTDYKWANNAPSGYTKVDNILSENMCKKEDEACYIDSAGEYKWGKYKNNPGYTLITSIVDSSKCRKMQNPACYTDGNIYLWDNSLPGSNFYIVDGIDDPTKCHPYEKPACYLYNDKYVWGQYASKSGYILVGGIEEKEYCNAGCYVNKNNEYVWGNYSDDSNYTLVPGITDRIKCGYTPDVPKTDMNVQTIVYIAVAVMSVAGIYFVVRYNNKSKKI